MKVMDLVRVRKTGDLAIIHTVTRGENGWYDSCSIQYLKGNNGHIVAWFSKSELEIIDNIAEIMCKMVNDSHCSGIKTYKLVEDKK